MLNVLCLPVPKDLATPMSAVGLTAEYKIERVAGRPGSISEDDRRCAASVLEAYNKRPVADAPAPAPRGGPTIKELRATGVLPPLAVVEGAAPVPPPSAGEKSVLDEIAAALWEKGADDGRESQGNNKQLGGRLRAIAMILRTHGRGDPAFIEKVVAEGGAP